MAKNNEVTGKKAGSTAGGLLASSKSKKVRRVAASDLTQVPNKPKAKKQ